MENRKLSPKTLFILGAGVIAGILILMFSSSSGPEPLTDMDKVRVMEQVIRLEQNQNKLVEQINSLSGWVTFFGFISILNLGILGFLVWKMISGKKNKE